MGEQFRKQKDKDHLNLLFNQQITASRRMIKFLVLILLVTSTATSAKKKSAKLAARIDALEKQMKSVGISLGSLCQVVDAIGDASATQFDCCSNPDSMQTRCERRDDNIMGMLGIEWNESTPGRCNSNDARCSVADGL